MDAGQIDELRRWGRQLAEDESRPELQPAGRAILLLIDEVERLQSEQSPKKPPSGDGGDAKAVEPEAEDRPPAKKRGFFDRFTASTGSESSPSSSGP